MSPHGQKTYLLRTMRSHQEQEWAGPRSGSLEVKGWRGMGLLGDRLQSLYQASGKTDRLQVTRGPHHYKYLSHRPRQGPTP